MIALNVNGKRVEVDAEADTPLLWVLRDYLDMTGTKYGCGMALCGACTVHVDGQPTRSCTLALSAINRGVEITTVGQSILIGTPLESMMLKARTRSRTANRCWPTIPGTGPYCSLR